MPPAQRPIAQAYIWTPASPLDRFPAPKFSPTVNKLAERFAIKAIEAQPLDYARAVWDDTVPVVRLEPLGLPQRRRPTTRTCSATTRSTVPDGSYRGYPSPEAYYARGNPHTVVVNPFAAVIRAYQRYVWLPGTVYGLILLVGLFGMVAAVAAGGRGPRCCRGCARWR